MDGSTDVCMDLSICACLRIGMRKGMCIGMCMHMVTDAGGIHL